MRNFLFHIQYYRGPIAIRVNILVFIKIKILGNSHIQQYFKFITYFIVIYGKCIRIQPKYYICTKIVLKCRKIIFSSRLKQNEKLLHVAMLWTVIYYIQDIAQKKDFNNTVCVYLKKVNQFSMESLVYLNFEDIN